MILFMIVFGTLNGLWSRCGKSKYLLGLLRESTLIYVSSLCGIVRQPGRLDVRLFVMHVGQLDLIRVECLYAHILLHWFHGRANKSG